MSSPKVFVSYSHDSDEHARRVRALADRLRADGVDCVLDQYETAPPEGWPRWMEHRVEEADFVLVVATATYKRRASGKERPGVGRGVNFESILIVQDLYEAGMWNERFVPVLLEGASPGDVIAPLKPYTYHAVATDEGYDGLYRHLTGQPRVAKPAVGKRRVLPPESGPAASAAKDEGGTEDDGTTEDKEADEEVASAVEKPPKPFWERWQTRVVFAGGLVAIVAGLVAIATGVLDIPAKLRQVNPSPPAAGTELQTQLLKGEILDEVTGEPLVDVMVYLPKHDLRTTTNDIGPFTFQVPAKEPLQVQIRARPPGYVALNADVLAGSDHLNKFPLRKKQ